MQIKMTSAVKNYEKAYQWDQVDDKRFKTKRIETKNLNLTDIFCRYIEIMEVM